jgi:uncharacterized membrane protein YGL010W
VELGKGIAVVLLTAITLLHNPVLSSGDSELLMALSQKADER